MLLLAVSAGVVLTLSFSSGAAPRKQVAVDGSRTRAVHTVALYDETGQQIHPGDNPAMPFSGRMTCGDCHDYDKISAGWHFNSALSLAEPDKVKQLGWSQPTPGRPGEPWMLVDDDTGTQIPLSYRPWPGTWRPRDVGMSQWDFVKKFGRHMPGGDAGEPLPMLGEGEGEDASEKADETTDPDSRWCVSGRLEINCLACHNAAHNQNQSEWAIQIARENLRWAATGASSLGVIENIAAFLPETADPFNPNRDNPFEGFPYVVYDKSRFDEKDRVFFDVTRTPPANRCYFCHVTAPANVDPETLWQRDADVHMAAGLACTDCHRNNLGHDIVRGYEGESKDPARRMLTCRGCHLGEPGAPGVASMGGRLGAPRPRHKNFPAIHLEKIACTTCHSGYLLEKTAGRVRTARANRLGIHGKAQWDTDLPYILSPVYIRGTDGVIAPNDMVWPAFWGRMTSGQVFPLPLDVVTPVVDAVREADKPVTPPAKTEEIAAAEGEGEGEANAEPAPQVEETPKPLTEAQIVKVLAALATQSGVQGDPVYISGGKLYKLAKGANGLSAWDHPVAQPYSWPIAHDVRPASQSLGSGGCCDCHDDDSGFFYAGVSADSPTGLWQPAAMKMYELQKLNPEFLEALDEGIELRMVFVIGFLVIAAVLAVALAHYGFVGLEGLMRIFVAPGSREE